MIALTNQKLDLISPQRNYEKQIFFINLIFYFIDFNKKKKLNRLMR